MDIVKCIAVIAAAVPLVCSAASQNNAEQVTCSGTQTTDSTNGLQIDCVGSLTIVGGSLTSDTLIMLKASDALYLDKVTVKAPSVNLDGATISVGSTAKIVSTNYNFRAGNSLNIDGIIEKVSTGGQISIPGSGSSLPLPVLVDDAGGQVSISKTTPVEWRAWNISNSMISTIGAGSSIGSIKIGSDYAPRIEGKLVANGEIYGTLVANGAVHLTNANSSANNGVTITASSTLRGNAQSASAACAPSGTSSVFKTVESGTRFCAGSKKAFHRVQFLRATAECRVAPGSFDIAATQDFPWDTTQTKVAECNDIGGGNSSCALYDTSNSSNTAQPYAGRLALKWGRDGDIHGLSGRIIEKTADGCHSESTLKLVKRMP